MDKKMQQCIANNLRYLRDYYDYTQEDVAALLHISRTTYGILESGTKNMRTDLLVRLARIYQVPVDLLMERNYEKFARSVALSDGSVLPYRLFSIFPYFFFGSASIITRVETAMTAARMPSSGNAAGSNCFTPRAIR